MRYEVQVKMLEGPEYRPVYRTDDEGAAVAWAHSQRDNPNIAEMRIRDTQDGQKEEGNMKANWYTNEFEQEPDYVSAIYCGYTMSVQDAPGFPVEIYRSPGEVVEHRAEFDSMEYAQVWAEIMVDFITVGNTNRPQGKIT